jgi:PAS domain S-box-containing protein
MSDTHHPGGEQKPPRLAEAIFENLHEGVTVADCSLPDMPLIYVNRAFETLTGYPAEEVIGKNCRFLHGQDKDQPGLVQIRRCLQQGRTCTAVVKNYRKDGTLFHNELHLSPIHDAAGALAYYIGIQRDVSERIYAEESLWRLNDDLVRANKELNEANARLNELLYVAAHDLKSPLTSMIFSLEILQEKSERLSGAARKRFIKQLSAMAGHMRDIVVDVLEARRVESDGLKLHLEPIDIGRKARVVLRFHKAQARAKNIALKLAASASGPKALADRNSVLVVLDNLVSNAIKYSPRSSTVRLRVRKHGAVVRIEVEDQGPGIRPDEMPRLFERFSRLSSEPTGGEHSTGLGLYIVKNLVTLMRGTVWAESEPGAGARFLVELPCAR